MALQEAKRQVTHAKVGCFGGAGSGKTTFLSEMAIALSKEHHNSAPVAFFATEPGVDYVIPMFEREGVKLYVERSKAFKDLLNTVRDAQKMGCCALIVDSITHVWMEIVDAFCRERGISRPEFQHWRVIKGNWQEWANQYVNAPLHMLVAGRAGFEYEYEDGENGKKELVKGDSKMKAEGEFGYEADLLVELTSQMDKQEVRRNRKSGSGFKPKPEGKRMIHYALVRKSRVWDLNGKEFGWPDKTSYEPGDYKTVSECFKPFLNFLSIGESAGPVVDNSRTSDSMFSGGNGDGAYYRQKQQRTILLENLEETMKLLWPGTSEAAKKMKIKVAELLFGTRSWTEIQERVAFDILEVGVHALRDFEEKIKTEKAETEDGALNLLTNCRTSVLEAKAEEVF